MVEFRAAAFSLRLECAMTHAVLITQCLQRDFVGPLQPHDPLPNALHIGHEEARRLLGADPERGQLAQLMAWSRSVQGALEVIHVRDWHDPTDPGQRAHLDRFGAHCLADSDGAALVLGLDADAARPHVRVASATTLNDAESSELDGWMRALIAEHGADQLRVAVIGVWTEAKVTFLLYELLSRYGLTQLATCSAVCASSNRDRHFAALDQLRRILGVQVLDSVGDLAHWLAPEAPALTLPRHLDVGGLDIEGLRPADPEQARTEAVVALDRSVLRALYPDAQSVALHAISGGFSGADVYRVEGRDLNGHQIAPTVLKVGDRAAIGGERRSFEGIEGVLGNDAPSVRGLVEVGQRAGLKYAYAAMGSADVRTFKQLWQGGGEAFDAGRAEQVLEAVFGRILGRLTAARRYETLDLVRAYGFCDPDGAPRYGQSVLRNVRAALATPGHGWTREEGTIVLPDPAGDGALRLPCPSTLYGPALHEVRRGLRKGRHQVSYVHGDLNFANILVDGADNVWVIDFAHAGRTHSSRDLHKTESDLLFLLTPVDSEATLRQAMAMSDALLDVQDLAAPLPERPAGVTDPALLRAWPLFRAIRRHLAAICGSQRNPAHVDLPLLCYAAQTIAYDEANPWQRRLALYRAARLTERLLRRARADQTLRLDQVGADLWGPGRLSLTLCPGRADQGRDLQDDLATVAAAGVRHIVCLCTEGELASVGVRDYAARAADHGLTLHHFALFDQGAPPPAEVGPLLGRIEGLLAGGQHVLVHCMGGLGRTGVVAASLLVRQGRSAEAALREVRRARSPRAVETEAQERFVRVLADGSGGVGQGAA